MRIEDLEQAIDRHGGDLGRWPGDMRAAAEALISRDGKAARLVADARRLDTLLSEAMEPVPVDSALIGRIVSGLATTAHDSTAIRPTPRLAAWVGAAMIAFLSSGYAAGMALPTSDGEDTLAGLMFGGDLTADTDSAASWSQLL